MLRYARLLEHWLCQVGRLPPFGQFCIPPVGRFADFVSEVEELPLSEWLILPGLSGASLFNGKRPNTKVLALRCDFACAM